MLDGVLCVCVEAAEFDRQGHRTVEPFSPDSFSVSLNLPLSPTAAAKHRREEKFLPSGLHSPQFVPLKPDPEAVGKL